MFHFKPQQRKQRRTPHQCAVGRKLQIESLEPRTLLAGGGLLLSNDAYLTLSFAADGVSVAGQANALSAKFNAVVPADVWQEIIREAFQTWAVRTNADVGVVSDGGQPFGTPAAARGDARFGDIRIGAIAMDPNVEAVAVPVNRVVGGSWHADVLFNTNVAFSSASDIFEIALHEAGHVFGLDDNNDPNSPLHSGSIPTATAPTATDTANLQAIFGTRLPDVNEATAGGGPGTDNNSFAKATLLTVNQTSGEMAGSAPSLSYGDISSATDVDFYRLMTPSEYSGAITFRVRSGRMSLLAPRLQIYDASHQLLQQVDSTSTSGDDLSITLQNPGPASATYYVEVSAASAGVYGIGGYALSATLDAANPVSLAATATISDATLRKLPQDQIAKLFNVGGDNFFNEDAHSDDDLATADPLPSEADFANANRYDVVGSISDQGDTDFYRLRSPQISGGQTSVLTVTVNSLSVPGLVPKISAFDRDLNPLSVTVLAHGGGELVVQIDSIQSDRNYFLQISAEDPNGAFSTGNYDLTASFRDQPADFQTFASGAINPGTGQNTQTLYVARPQLFQFLLQSSSTPVSGPAAVLATIFNQSGQAVYRLASPLGQPRSAGAILLEPGTYTVSISLLTLGAVVNVPVSYVLSGTVLSDPFASDPSDPTLNPFANPDPGSGNAFLYPGGILSNDPFLWDSFTNTLPNGPPAADLQTQISLLLGSWWTWFWGQTGTNGPPLAQADTYSTAQNATLTVVKSSGVLSNDFDPEGGPMTTVLVAAPAVGTLQLNADGSFQYVPAPGYNGLVRFTYQASDFTQLSNTSKVTIAVGLLGDYDRNAVVNQSDYGVWLANFGSTTNLTADGNGNGVVDAADYTLWRDHVTVAAAAGAGANAAAPVAKSVAGTSAALPTSTNTVAPTTAPLQSVPIVSVAQQQTSTPMIEPINVTNTNATPILQASVAMVEDIARRQPSTGSNDRRHHLEPSVDHDAVFSDVEDWLNPTRVRIHLSADDYWPSSARLQSANVLTR